VQTWRIRQKEERLHAGPAWGDAGLVFTRLDGSALRPEWISQRFDLLITQYATIRRREADEWTIERIARRHRVTEQKVLVALESEPLPPIRFHDLCHRAATLALAAGVEMKVVGETLGHARYSFTADTYASVVPEVFKPTAEAAANVIPRRVGPPQQNQRSPRRSRLRGNRW
jgi:Phage integrase family